MSVLLIAIFMTTGIDGSVMLGKAEFKGKMLVTDCDVTAANLNQAAANQDDHSRFHYYCLKE